MPNLTVSETILEQLRLWGVKRIYGVAGDAIFGLMDALAKQQDIRFISVKHESVAALMASAEAKVTGGLGVCISQMGPGLANLINGLGDAYLDGYPVLVISGQAPLNKIGTRCKQYINQQELVRSVAGFTEIVVHPDAVAETLSNAVQTAMVLRTVSHLSIPSDLFTMPTSAKLHKPIQAQAGFPASRTIEEAVQIMRGANHPMMLAGESARGAEDEILSLAEAWGCGVASAYGAVGVIPDDFPLGLGGLGEGGNPYLSGRFREADTVLAVGTSWWPSEHTPTSASVIQIADRPSRLGNGLPADYGIAGNLKIILGQLQQQLMPYEIRTDWVKEMEQCKQAWAKQNEADGSQTGFPLHPARIVRTIERIISEDAVIALDTGDAALWFMRHFRAKKQKVLLSREWRTMGFGLPAAMAAKLCMPQGQAVCITGDGGLAMVLADLLTAVRYELDLTLILFNNGSLQMERNKMEKQGFLPEGTDVTNPDFVKLAESCGWKAFRVQAEDELEPLLQQSLSWSGPALLDVPTAQVPFPDYT